MTRKQAEALARQLDLGLDCGICIACLSIVSFALDKDDPQEIAYRLRVMTRDLWDDGLFEPAVKAMQRAHAAKVPDSTEGLADLLLRGGRGNMARAIVLRLAEKLADEGRAVRIVGPNAALGPFPAPPELN